jgi:hypothetical protein
LTLVLLAVAARLEPDANGYGTHQQLGLPPCTFVTLFGGRCPSCGMTTSWCHLIRGQLVAAARANVGGTLLGLLCLMAAPWALLSAWLGRLVGPLPGERLTIGTGLALVMITVVDWAARVLPR